MKQICRRMSLSEVFNVTAECVFTSDRPILIFFITDYLYVYVPDNRYAEPIFIYCYKVNK